MSSEMGRPTYKCNIACFLGFVFNVYNMIIIKDIVGPLSYQEKSLHFSKKKHTKALLCCLGFVFKAKSVYYFLINQTQHGP
jgi:hypothetical protein